MKTDNQELSIGNRDDALALLDEMLANIEKSNLQAIQAFRGMKNAIGSEGYYWPRIAALKDAIERGLV